MPQQRSSSLVAAALLAAVTTVVYFPARQFQFISLDDPQYVTANPVVLNGLTMPGVQWAFTTTSFYWHPLTWLSHMLDVEIFGSAASGPHLVNIVLHAANAGMLLLALARMTKSLAASFAVALLFALHPLHVESVAWVAERKDVLSTFFWMLCLYLYAGYSEKQSKRRLAGITLTFVIGLLAKPMILTLPFVLLLLDVWPLGRARGDGRETLPRLAIEKIPLFALSLLSIAITLASQQGTRAVVSLEALSLTERIGNALVSYVAYLRDMVWPVSLAPFYPLSPPSGIEIGVAALVLMAITAFAIRQAHARPYILGGWLWYLGTLAPVIGFVQAGDQGRADRFTYVPLVGIFVALAWLTKDLFARFNLPATARYSALGVFAVVLAILTRRQLMYWKDDLTLWGRTVAVTKGNYRAENLYGVALTDNGRLQEGIVHYEAAIRAWPQNPEAHNNLGAARIEQGRYQDAVHEFEAAVEARPYNAQFRHNLAAALDAAGRRADAILQVKAGLAIDPNSPALLEAAKAFGIK